MCCGVALQRSPTEGVPQLLAGNEALATGTVWACDSNLIRLMTSTSRMSHRHLSAAFVTIAGSTNCLVTSDQNQPTCPLPCPAPTDLRIGSQRMVLMAMIRFRSTCTETYGRLCKDSWPASVFIRLVGNTYAQHLVVSGFSPMVLASEFSFHRVRRSGLKVLDNAKKP